MNIELNYLAIVVAALAVFAFAAVYYMLLAGQAAKVSAAWAESTQPSPWVMGFELAKSLLTAVVVAGLVSLLGITDVIGALQLGFALWIAFPVVLLLGSVIHEKVPGTLAAIHAGDWLAKMVIIAVIVTVWR